MNFATFEYFEMLARERNFTRAAERLHITQQSLSSAIAKLERELGCQLVVRHVPLELTYAGEVFLGYATSLHEQYTTMQQEFWDISQNEEGALRVGIAFTRGDIDIYSTAPFYSESETALSIGYFQKCRNKVYGQILLPEGWCFKDTRLTLQSFFGEMTGIYEIMAE